MSHQIISSKPFIVLSQEQLFNELTPEECAIISGGLEVATTNVIDQGRARIRVDLRKGLKDQNFSGQFEECSGSFDDFSGELNVLCKLSSENVNSGKVLRIYRPKR